MIENQELIIVMLIVAIFVGWINNKTNDKKVHTEYNNVLAKAIKKAHSKINNIDEARKFVYEQLNFMYFFMIVIFYVKVL